MSLILEAGKDREDAGINPVTRNAEEEAPVINEQDKLLEDYSNALTKAQNFLNFNGISLGVPNHLEVDDLDYWGMITTLDQIKLAVFDITEQHRQVGTKPNIKEINLGERLSLSYDPDSGVINVPIGTNDHEITDLIPKPKENRIEGDAVVIDDEQFKIGQNVFVERDGTEVMDNDWKLLTYHPVDKNVIVVRESNPDSPMLSKKIPSDIFLAWQVAAKAGARIASPQSITEEKVDVPPLEEPEIKLPETQKIEEDTIAPAPIVETPNEVTQPVKIRDEELAVVETKSETLNPTEKLIAPEIETKEDIESLRKEYVTLSERAKRNSGEVNAHINSNVIEASRKYEEEKRLLADKIIEETYAKYNAKEKNADPYDIMAAKVESKRRIHDEIIAAENRAILDERISWRRENNGKWEKFTQFRDKSLNWYMGLSKNKRLLLTGAIGTTVGYFAGFAGGLGLVGYTAVRAGRIGASALASAGAGKWSQEHWSIEKAEEKGKEKKRVHSEEYSDLDLAKASEEYSKIEEETKKERKNLLRKQSLTTIAAGGMAGALFGAIEHASIGALEHSVGGSSALEHKTPKMGPVERIKVGRPDKIPEPGEALARDEALSAPKVASVQENLPTHEVIVSPKGSIWKLAEKGAADYDKFNSLDQSQKTYVISAIVNRDLEDPGAYGIPRGGTIWEGDKIDVSKVVGSKTQLDNFINKALKLSEAQKLSILENSKAVGSYVEAHPDEPIDADKIAEIISNKNSGEILAQKVDVGDNSDQIAYESSKFDGKLNDKVDDMGITREKVFVADDQNNPNNKDVVTSNRAALQDQIKSANNNPTRADLHDQVVEARAQNTKVAGLSTGEEGHTEHTGDVLEKRSMMGDFKRSLSSREDALKLQEAIDRGVNEVYSKSKWGIFNTKGTETEEWKLMSRLPAKKVIGFATHNSLESDLPENIKQELSNVPSHQQMLNHVVKDMMPQAKGLTPIEGENMRDYIMRLSNYIWKTGEVNNLSAKIAEQA